MSARKNFYKQQSIFTEKRIKRNKLKKGIPPYSKNINIHVLRNEPWEPYLFHSQDIAATLGIEINFTFSNYSDIPDFTLPESNVDLIIIWLNWSRYSRSSIKNLLNHINCGIQNLDNNNVYVVVPSAYYQNNLENLIINKNFNIIKIPKEMAEVNLNVRNRIKFGYFEKEIDYITNFIAINMSQNYTNSKIRVIISDFDHTLYSGIFSENESIKHDSKIHRRLRNVLRSLSERGVLLCAATKNNVDVPGKLFRSKILNPLISDDFVHIESNWENKSTNIVKILKGLNIDPLNVIFIDDNPRELEEAGEVYPDLLCINGFFTQEVIFLLENIFLYEIDNSKDSIRKRKKDLRVRIQRIEKFNSSNNDSDFLLKFKTKINSVRATDGDVLERAVTLFQKTNQFNFTFNRLNQEQVILQNYKSTDIELYVSSLKDDLSDSGIIAAIALARYPKKIEIIEFCISCRALGRGVEKYIFYSMLRTANLNQSSKIIECSVERNEKNKVAQDFMNFYFIGSERVILNIKKLEDSIDQKLFNIVHSL